MTRPSRAAIDAENDRMLKRQRDFRRAADIVTDAIAALDDVESVAVIGSVARPLWKEVPRFQPFRRTRIEIWHECKDLDLAVWIGSLSRLDDLRRSRDAALRAAATSGQGPTIAGHQVEIFLFEPGTDRHLGRLCAYNACPKAKPDCAVPGCGAVPFVKVIPSFTPRPDLLAPAPWASLYRRGAGRLMSALDLPTVVPDPR